ncbi:methyl-accepting chemotaxis protein [Halovenus sp. HT40]|uniref:methyl-accepting chemotaxis protein n=1 Tax=Halovenus sp. HT40 TaxID=3126691 RepID=UPI00300F396F
MDSYKLRFTLALSIIFLITAGSGVLIYTTVDNQLTTETEQRLVSTAESEAHQAEIWFEHTDRLLESSIRSTAISKNESSFRIWDQLTRISNREAISSTYFVDLDTGKSIVTAGETSGNETNTALPAATQSRIDELAAADRSEVQYSDPMEFDGRPAMLAVRETPSGDGRALIAVIDLHRLSEQLFGSAYDDTSTTTSVVNASGVTVLSSEPDTILEADQTWDEGHSGSGFETESADGGFAVGYAGIENHGWAVTNRVPTAQAFEMRSTVGNLIALLLGVLLVGLAGFGLTVGRTTIRSVGSLATSAETLSQGDLDTPIESERTDEFGTVFDSLEQLRRSLTSKIEAVESERDRAEEAKTAAQTAKQEAEEERARAEQLNEHLRERAESYSTVMARAAEGDLTQRMQPDSQSPAMVEVAESFNEMMNDLEATFREIQSFADAVAESSDEATAGTDEINQTTETVSQSIQRIASQTDSQRESLEDLSTEMTRHSEATENVADKAETAAALSREAATVATNGESTAQQSMAEMEAVQDSMATAVDNVQTLADLMSEIDEIVALIREIASETNMLALNANIEAARAGGDADSEGDGFAVVADEVKQLAEKTHSSATEVADLIEEVQQTTDETVAEIQTADERVEQTTVAVEEAVEAFVTVLDKTERTDDSLQEITEVMSAQANRAETVDDIVAQVEQQSHSTASDAADVSAAAQEQTAAVSQVDTSVKTLASRSSRLQSLLETFETADRNDRQPASTPALSPD